MQLIQDAMPEGVSAYAGAWRPTAEVPQVVYPYVVYTTMRYPDRHADDDDISWAVYVYMNLYCENDPGEKRKAVRQAMKAAGFGVSEEREEYDEATGTNNVSWTFVRRMTSDDEAET